VLYLMLLIVFLIMESTLFLMADSKSGNNNNDSLPSVVLLDGPEPLLLSFLGLPLVFFPVELSSDAGLLPL